MTTNTTKFDLFMNGKSTAVRVTVQVERAFRAKAADLKMTLAQAASTAQREHNGTLAEAITKWVGDMPLYPTRETYIAAAVELLRPVFKARGFELPATIRANIAFTSTGWRGKRRGEAWQSHWTADKVMEVMVDLKETDPTDILDILTHELCHIAQYVEAGKNGKKAGGHGKDFARIAKAMDLTEGFTVNKKGEKKWSAKHAGGGAEWKAWAAPLVEQLGICPHAAIGHFVKKQAEETKQTTRMLKLECTAENGATVGCEAVWRMSAKHIADKPRLNCPCCSEYIFNPHFEGEGETEEGREAAEWEAARKYDEALDAGTDLNVVAKIGKGVKKAVEKRQGRKSSVQEMLDDAAQQGIARRERAH
jgi:hypothetical protein